VSGPQLEDGFTRIANELLEAVMRANLSRRQYKVVLAVIRKTYGYGKKEAELTMTEIANMTGLDLAHVSRTVNELAKTATLLKRQGGGGQVIGLNKNYGQWHLAKLARVAKTASKTCQNGKHIKKKEIPPSEDAKSSSSPNGAKETIWTLGVQILLDSGLSREKAGSVLGRLVSQYGEQLASQAVAAASLKRPAEPTSWLFGYCKQKTAKKRKVAL
jgi:phage replication O-like protein O